MRLHCLAFAGVLLMASTARAEEPKDEARRLAGEGIELYEQGDFKTAVVRLQRADQLFRAPIHSVYLARALAQLGRLVEAERAYERAVATPVTDGEPASFETSRAAAREELQGLSARIPTIRVEADEPVSDRLRVTLDDKLLEAAQLSGVRVDPGPHVIGFQLGDGPIETEQVDAGEGSEQVVRVNVVDGEVRQDASSGGSHLLWPGLAFGIGGFGLVLGAVTGGLALSKAADVKDRCPNDVCPSGAIGEDAGAADTLGIVALTSLITGGAGVILGTTLFFVLDDDETQVSVRASPTGLQVTGRF